MPISNKILFAIILLLLTRTGIGQFHQFHQYTVADGMPFTEITSVYVSQKGCVWTASLTGDVCRFDGVKFDCDSPMKLGVGAFNHKFYETDSQLWMINDKGPPVYYKEGQWHKAANSPRLEFIHKNSEYGLVGVSPDAKVYHYDSFQNEWKHLADLPLTNKNGSCGKLGKLDVKNGTLVIQQFFDAGDMLYWRLTDLQKGSVRLLDSGKVRIIYMGLDHHYERTDDRHLIYVKGNFRKVVTNPEGEPIKAARYQMVKDKFCVLEKLNLGGGINTIRILEVKNGESVEIAHIYSSYEPLKIDNDRHGNIWMSTPGGLLQIQPAITTFFEGYPRMVSALHVINEDKEGNIWFGGYGDGLRFYDGQKIKTPNNELAKIKRLLPGHYSDGKGNMFFWEERKGLIKTDGKEWKLIKPPNMADKNLVVGYIMHPLKDNHIGLGLSQYGLGITQLPLVEGQDWKVIGKDKGLELTNVLSVAQDKAGRVWCSRSSRGIALYDPQKDTAFTWLNKGAADHDLGSMAIIVDGQENLWLGTKHGLYIIESPEKVPLFDADLGKYARKVPVKGVDNVMVNALGIYDNFLVFSNEKGHGFLNLNSFYKDARPETFFFDTKAIRLGGSGEQNAIFTDSRGKLWIGKDRGAICVDMEKIYFDTTTSSIRIQQLMAGNERIHYSAGGEVKLPVDRRTLTLTVASKFTGYVSNKVSYEYRIMREGQEESGFAEVNGNGDIRFDYLSPGTYQMEIRAYKNNQLIDQLSIPTHVPYHWFENPKIIIGVISIIALGIFGALYVVYSTKYRAKKAQLKVAQLSGRADQMQVKAITSALNPHFINNSLHWLQSKVKNNNEAVKVISRMSENIRMVFQQSRQGTPYHSLKEELRLVENYLYIQHTRYGDIYESKTPKLDQLGLLGDILVPILQIQIHVENAIEHGILNRIKATFLKVEIVDEDKFVHIRVSDDGIGRMRAKELESKGTQQGVVMLNSLHRIYNQNNDLPISSWYEDLPFSDAESGEKVGTIVHIKIPKNYNYEIR